MSRGGNAYRPLDELLETPLLRLLRGLSRFDWVSGRDLFDAIEVPQYTVDAEARNVYSVTLSRLVKRRLAECRGPHSSRDYRITALGRRTLQDGFDAVQDAIDYAEAAKRKKRAATRSGTRKWTAEKLAAQRAEYQRRKVNRLCVTCQAGLRESDGVRCVECRASLDASTKRWNAKKRKSRSAEARRAWRASRVDLERQRNRDRYWGNKQDGLCVQCSAPAGDTVLCEQCCERHRQRVREYDRRRSAERRAAGICRSCNEPVVEGKQRCRQHLDAYNEWQQAWQRRQKSRAA